MKMQNEKEVGIKNRQGLTMREIMARGDEKSSRVEILTREISRRESAMAFKFNGFRFALGMLMMKLDVFCCLWLMLIYLNHLLFLVF